RSSPYRRYRPAVGPSGVAPAYLPRQPWRMSCPNSSREVACNFVTEFVPLVDEAEALIERNHLTLRLPVRTRCLEIHELCWPYHCRRPRFVVRRPARESVGGRSASDPKLAAAARPRRGREWRPAPPHRVHDRGDCARRQD